MRHYTLGLYMPSADVRGYASKPATLLDGTSTSQLDAAVQQAMHYPEVARREKISGTVQVEFVVDANGIVREPHVLQPLCASCDQAVVEALTSLGPFLPARQNDQPTAIKLRLTVPFAPEPASK